MKIGDRVRLTAEASSKLGPPANREGRIAEKISGQVFEVIWDGTKTAQLCHVSFLEPIKKEEAA